MIVDSSAVLAILFREEGADALLSAIVDAEFAGIGTPTLVETGIVLTRRLHADATQPLLRFLHDAAVEIVPFTELHWRRAVEAYVRFGKGRHPALNFGDCMTYATADLARQPLLCRGDDFPKTDLEIA